MCAFRASQGRNNRLLTNAKKQPIDQPTRNLFIVPPGVQRQAVVGDHVGALLRRAQMAQLDHRHFAQFELARCRQATMACDDPVVAIDQDGLGSAELHDAGCDLGDLGWRMRTRITRVGQQRIDRAVFELQVWRHGIEKPTERCRRAGWKYSGGGNLFFRAVAIEISRCCPPHTVLARKDPSIFRRTPQQYDWHRPSAVCVFPHLALLKATIFL